MGNIKYGILHFVQLGLTLFSLYYDYYYVDLSKFSPKNDIQFYKGRLKFLTLWNMLLQAIFFTIALLNDLIGTNEHFPRKPVLIRKIKDTIFASLAFPLASFVSVTFWALYLIDRELVLPRALDPYFPFWLNHCMHTNILLFIVVEFTTTFRQYPTRATCVSILAIVMLSYLVWIHVIHAYTNMWVYPVLDVLNVPLRIVFFVALLSGALALYWLGEILNRWYYRDVMILSRHSTIMSGTKRQKRQKRRKSKVTFFDRGNKRRDSESSGSGAKAN